LSPTSESGSRLNNATGQFLLDSPEKTRFFAARLAPLLPQNCLIALYGTLGAGKTTFVQGLLQGLGGALGDLAQSPTFTYLHLYNSTPPLYHFDLYRLSRAEDFFAMGFEESFEAGGIVAIEWPERIAGHLPKPHLEIRLEHAGETRVCTIRWIEETPCSL